nr:Ribosomal protein S1 RNA binding domain [Hymenolepis microstoma]
MGYLQFEVKLRKNFTNTLKDLLDKGQNASTERIYLNGFLRDIGAITNLTDAQFYSTSMPALVAFTPSVRDNSRNKFLENVDETLALVSSDLLQQSGGEITFIYDDSNKLFFLIHLLKNIDFDTLQLTDGWMDDTNVVKMLINVFKSAGNSHTYVLLFQPETNLDYSRKFLRLAILNQQLRSGIRIIDFSTVLGCQAYSDYLQTGASLVTFGLSTAYAPETPSSFYESNWRSAALYLDGLTYITKDGSEMSGDYILSRIRFTSTKPTSSPVESVAILDCSKNANIGIGSWIRNKEKRLSLQNINSTIVGRTIKVGVIKYAPFHDKGLGFSIAIMKIMKNVAKVNFVVVEYNVTSDCAYFLKMQKALEEGDIDAGFVPVPLDALNLQSVGGTAATITAAYVLLRQRPDRPPDFLLILRPLSTPVWLATLVLALIFMGLLMFFGHLRPVIGRNLAEEQISTKRALLEVSILGVISSFSLTKLQIIPTTLSSRLFALMLYASAMMTILLRIRKPSNADITVEEVLDSSACNKLVVLQNGVSFEAIVASLDSIAQKYTPVESLETAHEEVMRSKKTVLLASSIEASYLTITNCNLETIPYTPIYGTTLTFPYRKSWNLGPQFDFYFSVLSESGVLSKASSLYFETGGCYHPNHNIPTSVVLEPKDTASIFIFLLIGIIMALLFFGAEIASKSNCIRRKKKTARFLPGRHYPAVITSIKQNGVYVATSISPDTIFIPNSQLHTDPVKVYNALDMGLAEGDSIEITYFGKDSNGTTKLFCRHFPE